MEGGHIHLSVISVAITASIVVLTVFALHMAALKMVNSDNETMQGWGRAFAAGWG